MITCYNSPFFCFNFLFWINNMNAFVQFDCKFRHRETLLQLKCIYEINFSMHWCWIIWRRLDESCSTRTISLLVRDNCYVRLIGLTFHVLIFFLVSELSWFHCFVVWFLLSDQKTNIKWILFFIIMIFNYILSL